MPRPHQPAAPPASPDEIEQQFYEALQRADLDRLMALWADDEEIACVHPGGPRLIGAVAIRAAFEAIFANGPVDARPSQARRLQTHGCAVHSVVEEVHVVTPDGPRTAFVVATNVYTLGALGWRLVVHHASPGSALEAQPMPGPGSVLH